MNDDTYTTNQVAAIADATLRQLQWWDEKRVVSVAQDGHSRQYLREELVMVCLVSELRKKGFSLQKIRPLLSKAKRFIDRSEHRYLILDGTKLIAASDPDDIIEHVTGMRGAVLIDLKHIAERIDRQRVEPERRPAARPQFDYADPMEAWMR